MTHSVYSLRTLSLDGTSYEGEATWEFIATLIEKAHNLTTLCIRSQRQKRKIKLEVQVAEPQPNSEETKVP